ncbi:amidohydrolase [Pontibacter sp. G13]|uniref:amidohydrolase n=1 Tax=Pontibacter sp. G13 TaxID=3074898 RepID=UPI0028890617|nr:amidohydrolase [Pontibacter sp. G13]WNJ16655.1 amidohydrolase [Pontibacter sp. G13]
MRFLPWPLPLLLVGLYACSPPSDQAPFDLVFQNGHIYTVNPEQPEAEVVGVVGHEIAFVGSAAEAAARMGSSTKVVDLDGQTLIPGFVESHGHLLNLGRQQQRLQLAKAANFEAVAEQVAEAAAHSQPGEWILGRGWHQDKWDVQPAVKVDGFPTHDLLSEAAPDNPVLLVHASGHAAIANAKAMEIAGIEANQIFGEGGEIILDEAGNPTGLFVENAESLIADMIPAETRESREEALQLAIEASHEAGVTSFHDAGAADETLDILKDWEESGELSLRVYTMLMGSDTTLLKDWYEAGPKIDPTGYLTIRAIKLWADGALGSRGAWLLSPYTDMPGTSGMATLPMKYVRTVSDDALEHGFQLCVHAIGDRANREVLDQYEAAFAAHPAQDHRFRIEHAQHLDQADIPRFAEMGVIASVQGIHMASDRPWAIRRLGPKRIIAGAYVWQKLIQSGAVVINGTDVPVEPISPIACFYASVSRKTLLQQPDEGYEADQRMTREQALKSYTLDAAFGAFEEAYKGSLEVGKVADFTVLSQDIMQIEESAILDTEVMMTVVGGDIVFEAEP